MEKPVEEWTEADIRERFGFTKTKPLVYKQPGEHGIRTLPVEQVSLISLDSDGKVGSLSVTAGGFAHRMCSLYLKEMQNASFSFDSSGE